MALTRTADLYLHNARPPGSVLLSSLTDRTVPEAPSWIEGDKCLLRVRFCDVPAAINAAISTSALPDDNVIVLGAKKVRGSGAVLFNATAWTKVVNGADTYYQAVLNLNTVNLAAAFGSEQVLAVWVDIEVQAPALDEGEEADRATWQFQVAIRRQAYAGEAPVAEGPPVMPAPEMLVLKNPANAAYRFLPDASGGGVVLQLLNGTTGKFHSLFLIGEAGAETLAWGPAREPEEADAESLALKQPTNGGYRIVSDGGAGLVLQLKNATTGKFHSLFLMGAAGAETIGWGAGEV